MKKLLLILLISSTSQARVVTITHKAYFQQSKVNKSTFYNLFSNLRRRMIA